MKSAINGARLSVLSLALCGAFSVYGQTDAKGALSEVVVMASRFAESATSLTYSASVITAQDIRDTGASSVNEAIAKILGVPTKLDTSGGGNFSVDLRGFGEFANRNQVIVVDGRRLRDDDLSATNMANIPIESVERIEVMRGSGAVQYGEGASGGVIVITTKAGKGSVRNNALSTYLSVGSFGEREIGTSAVLASGGFSVDVSAKDAKSDGFRSNFASTSNSLSGTAQWSNDWLRLGVTSGRQIVQSGWPGSLTDLEFANNSAQSLNQNDYGYAKSDNSGVFAEASWGDWQLALDANQRNRSTRSDNSGVSAASITASDFNLRGRYEHSYGEVNNALVLGLDTSKWANTVLASTYKTIGSIADVSSSAIYVTDDVDFVPSGTRLSLGLRKDAVKKAESSKGISLDETPTAWQVGVSQEMPAGLVAYGHIGSSYRLATADEYTFAPTGVVLQTQSSRDSELGLRWSNDISQAGVRVYRSELTNEIGFDNLIYKDVNFDPTLRRGVELEARHKLSATLTGRFNAAYREALLTAGSSAGNSFPQVPHQSAAVGLTWKFAQGHTLDGNVNWIASQVTDASNQCSTPAYTTADAHYAYTSGNVELGLGVKNLTDLKYYTLAYGCNGTQSTYIYPEAGRAVTATARLTF